LTEEGDKSIHRLDFGFSHIDHSNHAWFTQKLIEPRIFDKGRVKEHDEKLRMPNFHFSDEEVEAVVTVLLGLVREKPEAKIVPRNTRNLQIENGQKIVRQLNCRGCHLIEGEGGTIQSSVKDWLQKYDNRTAAEADAVVTSFSPPNLIGEGKKVRTKWLFDFIHHPTTIRPWLKARMPTFNFNATELNDLLKYFSALDDQEFPFESNIDTSLTPSELEAAEKLFSDDYFACANCHIVGNKVPGGSPDSWAPNFALSKNRLKPEWIEQWIMNPQSLLPGTKMPNYFDPQAFDVSGPDDILNGDEHEQIRVLRNFLLTLTEESATTENTMSVERSASQAADQTSQVSPAITDN
jgi:cytochrome c2